MGLHYYRKSNAPSRATCQVRHNVFDRAHGCVHLRTQFKVLVFTYRAVHGQAPAYINDLIHPHSTTRALRSSEQGLLRVPRTRLKTKGDRAFEAVAPRLWNYLPQKLRASASVEMFKGQLKTHLSDRPLGRQRRRVRSCFSLEFILCFTCCVLCLLFYIL